MKYFIEVAETLYEIIENVNVKLNEGWKLRGDIVFCHDTRRKSADSTHTPSFFIQAMTKE